MRYPGELYRVYLFNSSSDLLLLYRPLYKDQLIRHLLEFSKFSNNVLMPHTLLYAQPIHFRSNHTLKYFWKLIYIQVWHAFLGALNVCLTWNSLNNDMQVNCALLKITIWSENCEVGVWSEYISSHFRLNKITFIKKLFSFFCSFTIYPFHLLYLLGFLL